MFKVSSLTISYSFFSKNLNDIKIKDKGLIETIVQTITYCIERTLSVYFFIKSIFLSSESSKWGFFLSKIDKEHLQNFKISRKILENQVNQRLKELKKNQGGNLNHDFLEFYLNLYLQNPTPEYLEQMIQQFYSLLTGGSDSTSILAGACLYCLAKYPEQYKLLQNIINQLPDIVQFQAVQKIPQLTYFIKEVSRFFPPAFDIFPRVIKQQIKLGQFTFPKNTFFGISIKNIMNDQAYYQNPQSFNPRRWAKNTIPKLAYMTFSGGARSCIGQQLALLELKRILIQFIKKFRVKLNPDAELVMKISGLYKSENEQLIIPIAK